MPESTTQEQETTKMSTTSRQEETASLIQQAFAPSDDAEATAIQALIDSLQLSPHIEGGYFRVTDVSPTTIPSPYPLTPLSRETLSLAGAATGDGDGDGEAGDDISVRRTSTTIFYYLTPRRPQGTFHANRSRIIHTLIRGRGRYVLLHPARDGRGARLETFVVGHDVDAGERLTWVVEGGVWKASFLLPDGDDESGSGTGLLISETVVPGFDYHDHEFLTPEGLEGLGLAPPTADKVRWLVREREAGASKEVGGGGAARDAVEESGGSSRQNVNPRLSQAGS